MPAARRSLGPSADARRRTTIVSRCWSGQPVQLHRFLTINVMNGILCMDVSANIGLGTLVRVILTRSVHTMPSTITSSPPPRSRPRHRILASALGALVLMPVAVLAGTSPASADTRQFRGVNWAVLGDNFVTGPLVLDGLSQSDSYSTVRAKADAIYTGFDNQLGVNTVRLPVNTHTVGSSWWNAYRGTIDAATARGFKVILAYWEDGAASGGRITNTAAFNSMWDTVIAQYGSNSLVHFEPMNEPHGYSATEWTNLAASWINARPSIPRGRIFVGGTGYSQDIRPVCADSRLDGTLLSYHHYTFFYGERDYAGWVQSFRERLGDCAYRAVATEFGAQMDFGLNYNDAGSTNNFVRYFRAVTDSMRDLAMGSVYWPAIGGKISEYGYDRYSMFVLQGSGTNLTLSIRNATGADRLRHGWGDGGGDTATVTLTMRHSAKCVDVISASTADGAEIAQYVCNGGSNQRWEFQDLGGGYYRIVARHSGKCVDVDAASTADRARIIQWTCHGGQNQQWQVQDAGSGYVRLVARHSGKCLDVANSSTADGARLTQFSCGSGQNQQFTRNAA
ncbi:RICIN domain-containing protein [Solwaraspora sp. WMMB335]|uniref:RICIN domain-containing protein n=1 Tax=Solwaraspora sp. WMMB335 TaxID=3404118 RepID=UPI003B9304BA